ncbi:putative O-acetyltransferase OatA [Octadecabacter antarcticus 307]|uniref:Putative O-acetyltransferase OatA n=1 Tax=Octadecabacter antarcticus 307 TaxID=391626 RepID=M9R471_9RHOB|nr:acyltransferase family protein [Octadecabacter antarcticus]AGI67002.1 putative O-acetyltransferase OatA [Octadecabacter antarcticus 307]
MVTGHQGEIREIRNDIDGLRALAVMIVVFYHIGFSDFGGGFIGVDVFFVISGYLIIPAILRHTTNGTFLVTDFMLRRLRRLVPALLPVLVFSTLMALLYLSDSALADFTNSVFSASGFISNFIFFGQSGYFERDSGTILLLHSWSLGVEFQFYLIVAVLAVVVSSRMRAMLIMLGMLSFFGAEMLVQNDSSYAFFGVLPRFWELAFGGVLGLLQGSFLGTLRTAWVMRLLGLGIILASAVLYRESLPFPGISALLPVLGAGLIVAAPAQPRDPSYRFLTSRVMQWIGTRSYSIYLWHWPLIVSLKLIVISPSEGELIAVALLAFPIAELSYRFIETPVRQGIWWRPPSRTLAILLVPLLVLGSIWAVDRQTSFISASRQYLPFHETRVIGALAEEPRSEYFAQMDAMGTDGRRGLCSLDEYKTVLQTIDCLVTTVQNAGDDSRQPILIIGDSHGRDMFRTLGYAFPDANLIMLHQSGCAPSEYSNRANSICFPDLNEGFEQVLETVQPHLVVLVSHWPAASIAPTARTLSILKTWGGAVAIIGPGPKFRNHTVGLIQSLGIPFEELSTEALLPASFAFDVYGARDALTDMAQSAGIYVYDRLSVLCDAAGCLAFVPGDELVLMNFDNQHLTQAGMQFLAEDMKMDRQLRDLVIGILP